MLIPSSLMQSMASFVSQNVGAGNLKRAKKSMFTGIGIGLIFGCLVFTLIWFKGDLLASFFSTDASVIQNGFAYLKGFAPETRTVCNAIANHRCPARPMRPKPSSPLFCSA
jgi:Na+-driven multidrug efflux pump